MRIVLTKRSAVDVSKVPSSTECSTRAANSEAERAEERARQMRNFERVREEIEARRPDVVVLDEFLVAESLGYRDGARALACVDAWRDSAEVVLTGRWASEPLLERADYATEMVKRKHPYDEGVAARRGIEF